MSSELRNELELESASINNSGSTVTECNQTNKLKRQSNAIKTNLCQFGAQETTTTTTTTTTNTESSFSSFTKFNKLYFSQQTGSTQQAKSSTYSSSSSTSSTSSCSSSSGSNDTPNVINHSFFPAHSSLTLKNTPANSKLTSPIIKQKSTEPPALLPPSKAFNIENELIKYTKTLKITNNYLNSYKLGEHIRNGGFSEIYEGHQIKSKEKVIVKLIPKQKTKNWLMVHNKKYPAEILLHKMSNNISGVVRMLEFFEQEQEWIIIMPKLVNCVDLFDYLESKHRGRLAEPEACHFFTQLVRINQDLLNHGVVHRDLKSENLLVDLQTMKLVLIDFGASAICRQSQVQTQFYTDFHGTRQYKPPEYIMHKKYTAQASTIWTLGILLYDMCNGQLPFETEQEILDYNIQMKTQVTDEYKEILFDCLKKDPLLRPTLLQLLEYKWCVVNSGLYVPKTLATSTVIQQESAEASCTETTSKAGIVTTTTTSCTYKSQVSVESTSSSNSSCSSKLNL